MRFQEGVPTVYELVLEILNGLSDGKGDMENYRERGGWADYKKEIWPLVLKELKNRKISLVPLVEEEVLRNLRNKFLLS